MRKYQRLLVLFVLCVLMLSCNTSKQKGDDANGNFSDFFENFIKAFNQKDTLAVNKYLNPEYGFFVIDNPGAFSVVRHFDSFDEIMKMEGEYDIAYLKVLKVDCDLKNDKKPFYECETGWDKEGCYLEKYPKFKISDYYKTMIEYELTDSNAVKEEMDLSLKSEVMIVRLVYSTEAPIGFYFVKIDEKWYLLCIDKVTPCSA